MNTSIHFMLPERLDSQSQNWMKANIYQIKTEKKCLKQFEKKLKCF